MFDIGGLEMALIALIALLVIGPKDLPRVLRTVGHWMRKARSLAREFQSGLDDIVREADLEDAKKAIDSGRNFNIEKSIGDAVDPTGTMDKELRDVDKVARDAMTGKDEPRSESSTSSEDTSAEVSAPDGDGAAEKPAPSEKAPEAVAAQAPEPASEPKISERSEDLGTKKSA